MTLAFDESVKRSVLPIASVSSLCSSCSCQGRTREATGGIPKRSQAAGVGAIKALLGEWTRLYDAGEWNELPSSSLFGRHDPDVTRSASSERKKGNSAPVPS